MRGDTWVRIAVAILSGWLWSPWAAAQQIRLTDHTLGSGIDFVHQDGSSGQQYLVELMGAGVALLDANNDGWIDVLLLNGATLPSSGQPSSGQPSSGQPSSRQPSSRQVAPSREALYLNQHDGSFVDVSLHSGAGDATYSLGVVAGDYNNDGFEDLYLSNFDPNSLLLNLGEGLATDRDGLANARFGLISLS